MTGSNDIVAQEAAAWLARTDRPDFTDWEGFLHWLEADPAHAEAYDRAALESLRPSLALTRFRASGLRRG